MPDNDKGRLTGDNYRHRRKLVHLPGTDLTPEVVLARTLQKCSRIKQVAVVILWDDGTYDTDYSNMMVSELVLSARRLTADADLRFLGTAALVPVGSEPDPGSPAAS